MVAVCLASLACTTTPVPVPSRSVPSAAATSAHSIVLTHPYALPLDIVDRSGHLTAAIEATASEVARLELPAVATAFRGQTATDLFVGWTGGACDASATLTLGEDPHVVAIQSVQGTPPSPRDGVLEGCSDVGYSRFVKLTFDEAVADIGRPAATQPATPTSSMPSASPSSSPTASMTAPGPTGVAWRAVPAPTLVGLTFTSVTGWENGFVALGEDYSHQLVVVRSTDGLTWKRGALPGSRLPARAGATGIDAQRAQVTADGSRLVIVATLRNADGHGTNRVAIWTSQDAADWKRLPDQPDFAVGGGGVTGAFVVDGTFYATATGDLEFWDDVEAIFRSADGSRWTRIPRLGHNGSGVIIVRPGVHGLVGVIRIGDEGFMIARSPDGQAWTNLGQTPQDREVMVWELPAGYLAGNEPADGVPLALAASPATGSWKFITPDPPGRPALISDVAASGDRVVGVGSLLDADGSPCCGAYAVISTDGGATWTASSGWPDMTDACMSAVAIHERTSVAVGACEESRDGPAAWVATLP